VARRAAMLASPVPPGDPGRETVIELGLAGITRIK
jgi:hypothetical protein